MFFYSVPKEIPIFLAYSSKFHWSSTGGGGGELDGGMVWVLNAIAHFTCCMNTLQNTLKL